LNRVADVLSRKIDAVVALKHNFSGKAWRWTKAQEQYSEKKISHGFIFQVNKNGVKIIYDAP
jgi:hypothetical protein